MTDYKMSAEERILAIDYGLKRVGLALTDPLKIFAYPYKTLQNDAMFWKNLDQVIKENGVVKIVLGYPLLENGSKSEMTLAVEAFCEEIKKRYKLETVFWDERYSSGLAWDNIISSVKSRKKRRDKGLIDMNAAAIILQEYLREN